MINPAHEKLLNEARERFHQAWEEEQFIRAEAQKDLQFVAGDQWNPEDKQNRKLWKRPCLTFNKLPAYIQQVANEARQNKPVIKFSPVDSGADLETAKIYEGIARHIQYDSDADEAYETALEYAASCSFGYFRYTTTFCSNEVPEDPTDVSAFDLEIKTRTVPDPFAVYGVIIPAALKQECRFAFVVESLTKEEFKAKYPTAQEIDFAEVSTTRHIGDWFMDERIQVAEYWRLEQIATKLNLITDGVQDLVISDDVLPEGFKLKRSRRLLKNVVKSCLINGVEVLPDTEETWPGSSIPIVPVLGRQMIVDGRVQLFSLIRFSRDPQALINATKSRIAETLATSPVSPWVAEEGQLEGREKEWQEAHLKPTAVLQYKKVGSNGTFVGAPQRQTFEPPIGSMTAFVMAETDDIKQSTSIFDASLGAQGNETSGVAISRRQRQSSIVNYHFIDNLSRAHKKGGRIIAELIPKIYDTPQRVIRILGEDETSKLVTVNGPGVDSQTKKPTNYDLLAGKYDVTVSTGPGYTTQREEAFELLSQLAQAWPELVSVGGDIIMRNSNIPGGDELSERLKRRIPPELLGENEQDAQIPPQVQGQMQQMGAMIEQLTQALNEAQDKLETKLMDTESRERIEREKLQLERDRMILQAQLELAKLGAADDRFELEKTLQVLQAEQAAEREREAREEQAAAAAEQQELPRAA